MQSLLPARIAASALTLILVTGCAAPVAQSTPLADDAAIPAELATTAPVFAQTVIGPMACGPCSFYNTLLSGSADHRRAALQIPGADHEARVRSLIAGSGAQISETYGAPRRRYDERLGMAAPDMVTFANDFLIPAQLPKVRGRWLNRLDEETPTAHLRRVHGMLADATLPPMIELRAYHADTNPSGKTLWEGVGGHWVSVREIEALPPTGDVSGFLMRCADSVNGRLIPVFARVERHRPFTATRGFEVGANGKEKWAWLKNSPYLLLTVPDLSLNTQRADWHERSTIAMTFAVTE